MTANDTGDPSPYNVSITDQSAIIQFYPHRDGPIDTQWNVTYSNSAFVDWWYDDTFGSGVSTLTHHRMCVKMAYYPPCR